MQLLKQRADVKNGFMDGVQTESQTRPMLSDYDFLLLVHRPARVELDVNIGQEFCIQSLPEHFRPRTAHHPHVAKASRHAGDDL